MNFLNSTKLTVMGLSAIAVWGMPESVKAATFTVPINLSNVPVQTAVFGKYDEIGDEIETGTFQNEMESIDLTIDVPNMGTVLIREDPDKASLGETTVTDIGGGNFQVNSFFDIFAEVSIDGGNTWYESVDANGNPASMRVELAQVPNPAPNQIGCITGSFFLPPNCGGYWSPFHSWFRVPHPITGKPIKIHLSKVFHFGFGNIGRRPFPCAGPGPCLPRPPFCDEPGPCPPGPHQRENFDSNVQGEVEVSQSIPEASTTMGLLLFGIGTMAILKRPGMAQK
jgi:hypothetical protein